jgi:predicted transcriptional regulator
MSAKQLVLNTVQNLPDDADLATIRDEVALLAALEEAEEDVVEGRVIPHEEISKLVRQWATA